MRCVILILAAAVLAAPAAANTKDCGENAFSFAEVVESERGRQRTGPVISVPDSLCADLIEDRKPGVGSLNLHIGEAAGAPAPRSEPRRGERAPVR
jgi:hypothetical protein